VVWFRENLHVWCLNWEYTLTSYMECQFYLNSSWVGVYEFLVAPFRWSFSGSDILEAASRVTFGICHPYPTLLSRMADELWLKWHLLPLLKRVESVVVGIKLARCCVTYQYFFFLKDFLLLIGVVTQCV